MSTSTLPDFYWTSSAAERAGHTIWCNANVAEDCALENWEQEKGINSDELMGDEWAAAKLEIFQWAESYVADGMVTCDCGKGQS